MMGDGWPPSCFAKRGCIMVSDDDAAVAQPNEADFETMNVSRGYRPGYVYRFLDKAEHAEKFIDGRIRITTLEHCRKTEDAMRQDSAEGTAQLHVQCFESGAGIPVPPLLQRAFSTGEEFPPFNRFENITVVETHPDCFML